MLIGRGLQGVGISLFLIAFSIVRDLFPREKMAIGQGIITSMFAGGAVIGLSIGGIIIQHYGWQFTFFTIIPIVIALFFVVWRFVHLDPPPQQEEQKQQQEESEHMLKKVSNEIDNEPKNIRLLKRIKNVIRSSNEDNKPRRSIALDIKGAISLAISITSLLLFLSYLQTGEGNNSNSNTTVQLAIFLAAGIISLVSFILIERRSTPPLIDFKLLLNRGIPADIMILIVGLSIFLVFQTIPILVTNPPPFGFGGDAISTTRVQLPFAIVLLVFGPASGFIISKVGSTKSIIIGTVISAAGFFGLFLFHSTEFLLSANLGIVSVGLSLTAIGAQNTIVLNTPRQSSGISLGMASLLRIVGSSIGPALAAMYLQSYQYKVGNIGDVAKRRKIDPQNKVPACSSQDHDLVCSVLRNPVEGVHKFRMILSRKSQWTTVDVKFNYQNTLFVPAQLQAAVSREII